MAFIYGTMMRDRHMVIKGVRTELSGVLVLFLVGAVSGLIILPFLDRETPGMCYLFRILPRAKSKCDNEQWPDCMTNTPRTSCRWEGPFLHSACFKVAFLLNKNERYVDKNIYEVTHHVVRSSHSVRVACSNLVPVSFCSIVCSVEDRCLRHLVSLMKFFCFKGLILLSEFHAPRRHTPKDMK